MIFRFFLFSFCIVYGRKRINHLNIFYEYIFLIFHIRSSLRNPEITPSFLFITTYKIKELKPNQKKKNDTIDEK